MQLYFVRHGQSSNNHLAATTGSEVGRSDDPVLTDTGIQQAHAAARYLSRRSGSSPDDLKSLLNLDGFGITHLYCSLMVRAVHTATIIGDALGINPVGWEDAHEVGGIYLENERGEKAGQPGKNQAYFDQHFPRFQYPAQLGADGWHVARHYEDDQAGRARAERWLIELVDRHGKTNHQVAVVSHGAFFVHFMRSLLRIPKVAGHDIWMALANCSISRVDFSEHNPVVLYVNRFDYLPTGLVT